MKIVTRNDRQLLIKELEKRLQAKWKAEKTSQELQSKAPAETAAPLAAPVKKNKKTNMINPLPGMKKFSVVQHRFGVFQSTATDTRRYMPF